MDCTKIADFVPAISFIVSITAIAIIVILKYGNKIFDGEYKTSNPLIPVATFLFTIILIVHLFKEQTWTVDIFKILIGTLFGACSAKLSIRKSEINSSVNNSGSIEGDVAGRDINKNIQNIEKAVSEIKNSVVHQNNKIEKIVNTDNDYIINTIFNRGPKEMSSAISNVVKFWHSKGWALKHFCSDFNGMDGLILIFEKPKHSNDIKCYYYHNSNTKDFKEYEQNNEV